MSTTTENQSRFNRFFSSGKSAPSEKKMLPVTEIVDTSLESSPQQRDLMKFEYNSIKDDAFQTAVKARGETIFALMEADGPSLFSRDFWYGQIMEWSMKNEKFKTQMFRFVDVLPYLNSGSEIAKHLKEYFAEGGDELPKVFNFGVGIGALAPSLMATAIKKNVTGMAKMFITGESPEEALPVLKKARKSKIAFTVDILGEACLSEIEATEYINKYSELMSWLAKDSASWDHQPQIDEDHLGPIPKVNVSIKLTSLDPTVDLKAWETSKSNLKARVRPLMRQAIERGVFLNFDMEQYELKDFTLELFKELLLEPEFCKYPHFGCVVQAYLRDSKADVDALIDFAKQRRVPFTIRLVKGAYWDFETIFARQNGWTIPVFTNKRESDANYELCAATLLANWKTLRLAIGSHNVRSISAAIVTAERLGVDPRSFEIQMLYGMADGFKRSLVKQGYRVREYAPVGELIPGMAYLVRRLLENTSNESFLRSKFAENVSIERLMVDPAIDLKVSSADPKSYLPSANTFVNTPPTDFALKPQRERLLAALQKLKLGEEYPSIIDGEEVKTGRILESLDPSDGTTLIGKVHLCGISDAERAIAVAKMRYPEWAKLDVKERAQKVNRLADLFETHRLELVALQIREAGKPWDEADGDVAEAIDFCRYYAREALKLENGFKVGSVPGETSRYIYKARGVVTVIAPWNFPLAIITGMVVASVVTGNTVVMKPAEQTAVIGAWLMKLAREAGFPDGVVNLVQGYGEEIGDTLVMSPDVAMIAFTGSQAVGLKIIEKAAKMQPGQKQIKKVIAELGGKNAIIIDNDADLDEAIGGLLYSAFGFSGQKCSAASRAIVVEEIYDRFISRLKEAAKIIKSGPASDPDTFVGPVIDQEARDRILNTIAAGQQSAEILFQSATPKENGYYVPATIFTNVKETAAIARDEIFGPVLAILKVKNFEEALSVATSVDYALTGGLYSRSPANIELAKEKFEVGNLYINRGCTGAMVDRHPFGGFKLSGTASKTGGPEYLMQFTEARVITENTMRRGFAPVDEN